MIVQRALDDDSWRNDAQFCKFYSHNAFSVLCSNQQSLGLQNSMARCCDRYRYLQCFCLIILLYINVLLFTFTKSSLQSPWKVQIIPNCASLLLLSSCCCQLFRVKSPKKKKHSKKQKLKASSINYVNLLRNVPESFIFVRNLFNVRLLQFWNRCTVRNIQQNKFWKFNGCWWKQLNSLLNYSNKSIFENSILLYWFP